MRVLPELLLVLLLAACSAEQGSGPAEIRWDQQVCERCSMAIGDARFAAQVRGGPRQEAFRFDDIGCALVWLDGQPWKDAAATEIWVSDYENGGWLDARRANFVRVLNSPMGYGLGAIGMAAPESLEFDAALAHVHEVEKRDHLHRGQHRHREQPADGAS